MQLFNKNSQNLIILILGVIAVFAEAIVLVVMFFTPGVDKTMVTAIISFIAGITGGLIGVLNSDKLKKSSE